MLSYIQNTVEKVLLKKKNRNDRGTNFACRGMRKAEELGNKKVFTEKNWPWKICVILLNEESG